MADRGHLHEIICLVAFYSIAWGGIRAAYVRYGPGQGIVESVKHQNLVFILPGTEYHLTNAMRAVYAARNFNFVDCSFVILVTLPLCGIEL